MSGQTDLAATPAPAYLRKVITVVRLARVLLLLVLVVMTVSLVIGVVRPATGAVEKSVLLALIGGCVFLAAKVTTWEHRIEDRIRGA
jgi:hypothetical protein